MFILVDVIIADELERIEKEIKKMEDDYNENN